MTWDAPRAPASHSRGTHCAQSTSTAGFGVEISENRMRDTNQTFRWSQGETRRGRWQRMTSLTVFLATCLWLSASTAPILAFSPGLPLRPAASVNKSSRLSVKIPYIDQWRVLSNGRITGTVRNHPQIPDGDVITTSPLEVPDQAQKGKTMNTISGSKYQLGEPQQRTRKQNGEAIPLATLKLRAKKEYDLNGEIIGDDVRQYLLAGKPQKSTSGKSSIFLGYRSDGDGLPVGDIPLTIKVSSKVDNIEREAQNYARVTKGITRGKFVQCIDYLQPPCSAFTKKFGNAAALVLETGAMDLKRYCASNGRLQGKDLRNAAAAAAQCLQAVHNSGLVWTDMKTENFVVTSDGDVKGIDLESAMPKGDNPVDYSPEATPPEFARAFLAGDGPYFILQYNYDIWSFGMLLFELATGRGYWDGKTPMQITQTLRTGPDMDVSSVEDRTLRDLIQRCLQLDPTRRPNIVQILLHPYFLTTGIGPISFNL